MAYARRSKITGLFILPLLLGCAGKSDVQTSAPPRQELPLNQNFRDLLSSVTFDQNLTKAEADKVFGRGYPDGPAKEAIGYSLGVDHGLILSFSEDAEQKLTRAIVITGTVGPNPPPEILYNSLKKTTTRSCKDIKKRGMTADELFEIWGPFDGTFGSGIAFWQYWLANGQSAQVTFSDGKASIRCG